MDLFSRRKGPATPGTAPDTRPSPAGRGRGRQVPPCLGALAWLAGSGLVLLAAPAAGEPAQASGRGQCFLSSEVNGFTAPNDRTVYVRVGVSDVYRLDLMGDCGDLTFRQSLGFEHAPPSGWICSPLDATIIYRETGITQRCPVTAIHHLSPEELAALPKKDRP